MDKLNKLALAMTEFYAGQPSYIQHFFKVHAFAKLIAQAEGLDEAALLITEAAAYVHDIGIKPAMEKYSSAAGPLQEQEGPPLAEHMLDKLGFDEKVIERVSYLVGHHHTYSNIDGMDYRILVEADFLVNLFEGSASPAAIKSAYTDIFRTECGKTMCRTMFDLKA